MRNTALFWGVLVFTSLASGQSSWRMTYGGPFKDCGFCAQQTSDGGYIIIGFTCSFGAGTPSFADVYLIKADPQGDTLWTRTYGGNHDDRGYSVQQTLDSGHIIAGLTGSFGAGSCDVYLIKTNAQGDTLWTRTYGGANPDHGSSVAQASDSGYIIAGGTGSFGAGSNDVYLIKSDAQGDTLWTRTYGGTDYDEGHSVQQLPDGGYVIAGWTNSLGEGTPEYSNVYLIRTDAVGDTLWTRTYGGTDSDYGWSVRQTSDSGYIIAGQTMSFGAGDGDVYLIKTNAQGDALWAKTYGGANEDYGKSVLQVSDGGYAIVGQTWSFGAGDGDVYLVRTDAQGDTLWTRTCGGANEDCGNSVRQTSDGGYIVAGGTYSFGAGEGDVWLIKTDSNGNVGMAESSTRYLPDLAKPLLVQPNPFSSFARVPGREGERFVLSDIAGRQVGIYTGNRIGEGLRPGVYFLSPAADRGHSPVRPVRIVKAASR